MFVKTVILKISKSLVVLTVLATITTLFVKSSVTQMQKEINSNIDTLENTLSVQQEELNIVNTKLESKEAEIKDLKEQLDKIK